MSQPLAVIEALMAESIKQQMAPNRRYLSARERGEIAADAASVAVAVLLQHTGGNDHIIQSDGDTFPLQHPIAERINGDLFDCEIHAHIVAGEPLAKGRYRVTATGPEDIEITRIKEQHT